MSDGLAALFGCFAAGVVCGVVLGAIQRAVRIG